MPDALTTPEEKERKQAEDLAAAQAAGVDGAAPAPVDYSAKRSSADYYGGVNLGAPIETDEAGLVRIPFLESANMQRRREKWEEDRGKEGADYGDMLDALTASEFNLEKEPRRENGTISRLAPYGVKPETRKKIEALGGEIVQDSGPDGVFGYGQRAVFHVEDLDEEAKQRREEEDVKFEQENTVTDEQRSREKIVADGFHNKLARQLLSTIVYDTNRNVDKDKLFVVTTRPNEETGEEETIGLELSYRDADTALARASAGFRDEQQRKVVEAIEKAIYNEAFKLGKLPKAATLGEGDDKDDHILSKYRLDALRFPRGEEGIGVYLTSAEREEAVNFREYIRDTLEDKLKEMDFIIRMTEGGERSTEYDGKWSPFLNGRSAAAAYNPMLGIPIETNGKTYMYSLAEVRDALNKGKTSFVDLTDPENYKRFNRLVNAVDVAYEKARKDRSWLGPDGVLGHAIMRGAGNLALDTWMGRLVGAHFDDDTEEGFKQKQAVQKALSERFPEYSDSLSWRNAPVMVVEGAAELMPQLLLQAVETWVGGKVIGAAARARYGLGGKTFDALSAADKAIAIDRARKFADRSMKAWQLQISWMLNRPDTKGTVQEEALARGGSIDEGNSAGAYLTAAAYTAIEQALDPFVGMYRRMFTPFKKAAPWKTVRELLVKPWFGGVKEAGEENLQDNGAMRVYNALMYGTVGLRSQGETYVDAEGIERTSWKSVRKAIANTAVKTFGAGFFGGAHESASTAVEQKRLAPKYEALMAKRCIRRVEDAINAVGMKLEDLTARDRAMIVRSFANVSLDIDYRAKLDMLEKAGTDEAKRLASEVRKQMAALADENAKIYNVLGKGGKAIMDAYAARIDEDVEFGSGGLDMDVDGNYRDPRTGAVIANDHDSWENLAAARQDALIAALSFYKQTGLRIPISYTETDRDGVNHKIRYVEDRGEDGKLVSITVDDAADGRTPQGVDLTVRVGEDGVETEADAFDRAFELGRELAIQHNRLKQRDAAAESVAKDILAKFGAPNSEVHFYSTAEEIDRAFPLRDSTGKDIEANKEFRKNFLDDDGNLRMDVNGFTLPDGTVFVNRTAARTVGGLAGILMHESFHANFYNYCRNVLGIDESGNINRAKMKDLARLLGMKEAEAQRFAETLYYVDSETDRRIRNDASMSDEERAKALRMKSDAVWVLKGVFLGVDGALGFGSMSDKEKEAFRKAVTSAEEQIAYKAQEFSGLTLENDKAPVWNRLSHPIRMLTYRRMQKKYPAVAKLLHGFLSTYIGDDVTPESAADFVAMVYEKPGDGTESAVHFLGEEVPKTETERTVVAVRALGVDPDAARAAVEQAQHGEQGEEDNGGKEETDAGDQPVAPTPPPDAGPTPGGAAVEGPVATEQPPAEPAPEPTPEPTQEPAQEPVAETAQPQAQEPEPKKPEAKKTPKKKQKAEAKKPEPAPEPEKPAEPAKPEKPEPVRAEPEAKQPVETAKEPEKKPAEPVRKPLGATSAIDDATAVPAAVREVIRRANTAVDKNERLIRETTEAKSGKAISSKTRDARVKAVWEGKDGETISAVENLAFKLSDAISQWNANLPVSKDKSKADDARKAAKSRVDSARRAIKALVGADIGGRLLRGETLTEEDGKAILAKWEKDAEGKPAVRRTKGEERPAPEVKAARTERDRAAARERATKREKPVPQGVQEKVDKAIALNSEPKTAVEDSLLRDVKDGKKSPMQALSSAAKYSRTLASNDAGAIGVGKVASSPEGIATAIQMLTRVVNELNPKKDKSPENPRNLLSDYKRMWREKTGAMWGSPAAEMVRAVLPDHSDEVNAMPIGSAEIAADRKDIADPRSVHAVRQATNRDTGATVELRRPEDEEELDAEQVEAGMNAAEEVGNFSRADEAGVSPEMAEAEARREEAAGARAVASEVYGKEQEERIGDIDEEQAEETAEESEEPAAEAPMEKLARQAKLVKPTPTTWAAPEDLKKIAADKDTDPRILQQIALAHPNPDVRLACIENANKYLLAKMEEDRDAKVSNAAFAKLGKLLKSGESMFSGAESLEEIYAAKNALRPLVRRIFSNIDSLGDDATLDDVMARWDEIDKFFAENGFYSADFGWKSLLNYDARYFIENYKAVKENGLPKAVNVISLDGSSSVVQDTGTIATKSLKQNLKSIKRVIARYIDPNKSEEMFSSAESAAEVESSGAMFASGESSAIALRDIGQPRLWNNLQKAKSMLRRRPWDQLSHDDKVAIKRASDGWEMVDGAWVNDGDPVRFRRGNPLVDAMLGLSKRLHDAKREIAKFAIQRFRATGLFSTNEAVVQANRYAIGAVCRACGLAHPAVFDFTMIEDRFDGLRERADKIIGEKGGDLRQAYADFLSLGVGAQYLSDAVEGSEFDAAMAARPDLVNAKLVFEPVIENSIDTYGGHVSANGNILISLTGLIQGPDVVADALVHEFGHEMQGIEGWGPGGYVNAVGPNALARLHITGDEAYRRLSGEVMSRALEARRNLSREERLGSLLQDTMDMDVPAEDRLNLLEMRDDENGSFFLQASMASAMFSDAESQSLAEDLQAAKESIKIPAFSFKISKLTPSDEKILDRVLELSMPAPGSQITIDGEVLELYSGGDVLNPNTGEVVLMGFKLLTAARDKLVDEAKSWTDLIDAIDDVSELSLSLQIFPGPIFDFAKNRTPESDLLIKGILQNFNDDEHNRLIVNMFAPYLTEPQAEILLDRFGIKYLMYMHDVIKSPHLANRAIDIIESTIHSNSSDEKAEAAIAAANLAAAKIFVEESGTLYHDFYYRLLDVAEEMLKDSNEDFRSYAGAVFTNLVNKLPNYDRNAFDKLLAGLITDLSKKSFNAPVKELFDPNSVAGEDVALMRDFFRKFSATLTLDDFVHLAQVTSPAFAIAVCTRVPGILMTGIGTLSKEALANAVDVISDLEDSKIIGQFGGDAVIRGVFMNPNVDKEMLAEIALEAGFDLGTNFLNQLQSSKFSNDHYILWSLIEGCKYERPLDEDDVNAYDLYYKEASAFASKIIKYQLDNPDPILFDELLSLADERGWYGGYSLFDYIGDLLTPNQFDKLADPKINYTPRFLVALIVSGKLSDSQVLGMLDRWDLHLTDDAAASILAQAPANGYYSTILYKTLLKYKGPAETIRNLLGAETLEEYRELEQEALDTGNEYIALYLADNSWTSKETLAKLARCEFDWAKHGPSMASVVRRKVFDTLNNESRYSDEEVAFVFNSMSTEDGAKFYENTIFQYLLANRPNLEPLLKYDMPLSTAIRKAKDPLTDAATLQRLASHPVPIVAAFAKYNRANPDRHSYDKDKDLIVTRSVSAQTLKTYLDRYKTGMPAPSLGVVQADVGTRWDRPFVLLFKPIAADPSEYEGANLLFSGDAWTKSTLGGGGDFSDEFATFRYLYPHGQEQAIRQESQISHRAGSHVKKLVSFDEARAMKKAMVENEGGYFEAKPIRIVPWCELGAIVAPAIYEGQGLVEPFAQKAGIEIRWWSVSTEDDNTIAAAMTHEGRTDWLVTRNRIVAETARELGLVFSSAESSIEAHSPETMSKGERTIFTLVKAGLPKKAKIEDWAIVKTIRERYRSDDTSVGDFSVEHLLELQANPSRPAPFNENSRNGEFSMSTREEVRKANEGQFLDPDGNVGETRWWPKQGKRISKQLDDLMDRLSMGAELTDEMIDEINSTPEVKEARHASHNLKRELGGSDLSEILSARELEALRARLVASGSGMETDPITGEAFEPTRNATAFFLFGPPAAGKSAIAENLVHAYRARLLDNDERKKNCGDKYYRDGLGARICHQLAGSANLECFRIAVGKRENFVWPTLGKNLTSMLDDIRLAIDNGYEVHLVHNSVPPGVALGRALWRYLETGRFLPSRLFAGLEITRKNFDEAIGILGRGRTVLEEPGRNSVAQSSEGRDNAAGDGEGVPGGAVGGQVRGQRGGLDGQDVRVPPIGRNSQGDPGQGRIVEAREVSNDVARGDTIVPIRTIKFFSSAESSADLVGQYGSALQRRIVAADPNTPIPDLERLSHDDDVHVLRAVAKNPNTDESTLERLAGFGGDRAWVAAEVARRTDIQARLEETLAHHNVASVRVAFAKAHPEFGMTPAEARDWRNPEWGSGALQSSAASRSAAETAKFFGDHYGIDMRKFGLDPNDDGTIDYTMVMEDLQRRMQLYLGDTTFQFFDGRKSLNEMALRARETMDANPGIVRATLDQALEAAKEKKALPLDGTMLAVLYFHQMACEERFRAAFEAFAEQGLSEEDSLARRRELDAADAALEESALALGWVKSSQGQALAANKMMVRSDYTYGGLLSRTLQAIRKSRTLRMANRQGRLTESEKKQLREMAMKLNEAERKLAELTKQLQWEDVVGITTDEVDAAGSKARKDKRAGKKVETVDEAVAAATKALADRTDPTKDGAPINLADWPQVYAGIQDLVRRIGAAISAEYALAHPMKRMPIDAFARELFQRCSAVFGNLAAFDGSRGPLTQREYMELFADYDQMDRKAPLIDPVKKALQDIVRLAKMQEDLRRIKEGKLARDRYGFVKLYTEKDVDDEMERVRRELAEADRQSGLSNFVAMDSDAKATVLDRIKLGMMNEIRALDEAIESGVPLPPDLAETVEDGDVKTLRRIRAERRSDDERMKLVERELRSQIANANARLANAKRNGRTGMFRIGKDGGLHYIHDTDEVRRLKRFLARKNRLIQEILAESNPEMQRALLAGRALEAQKRRQQFYTDKKARIEEDIRDAEKNSEEYRKKLRARKKNLAFYGNEEWREAWRKANDLRHEADELMGKLVWDRSTKAGKALIWTGSVKDVARSWLASGDESGIGIQSAWYMLQHPAKAVWAAIEGARAMRDKDWFEAQVKEFLDSDRAPMIIEQAGIKIPLAEYGYGSAGSEEVFARNYVAKHKFGILGDNRWLRASERGFSWPVIKFRLDMANRYIDLLESVYGKGNIPADDLKYMGRIVNAVTGAGDFWGKGAIKAAAANFLWAPGRLAGQLQTLTLPFTNNRWIHPEVSKQLLGQIGREHVYGALAKLGAVYIMLALASKLFYDDDDEPLVEWDPTSSKFGRIRIGTRYVSITGNLEQYIRPIARVVIGWSKGRSGVPRKYESGPATSGFRDDLWRMIQGKLRPDLSAFITLMDGKDSVGKEVDRNPKHFFWENGLGSFLLFDNMAPMTEKECYEIARANGVPESVLLGMLAWIGISGTDYGETPYDRARARVDALDAALKSEDLTDKEKAFIRSDNMNRRLLSQKTKLNGLKRRASELKKKEKKAGSTQERDRYRAEREQLEKQYIETVYWKSKE